jgi:hypothetical protein
MESQYRDTAVGIRTPVMSKKNTRGTQSTEPARNELRLLQDGIGRVSAPVRAARPEKRRESIGTMFSLTGFSQVYLCRTSTT